MPIHLVDIVQMWQCLWPLRLATLKIIETQIWEALFSIGMLKVDGREILLNLSRVIKDVLETPMYELQSDWFGKQGK